MNIVDLPTPCLVLDRRLLMRNLSSVARSIARHDVPLRPHMKTAKSVEVARLTAAACGIEAAAMGITVSTVAEAEYFAAHGFTNILYAVAITPQKLPDIARLRTAGANVTVVTDDPATAKTIADYRVLLRAVIEIDCGEGRGGLSADDPNVLEVGRRLGGALAGVMTHAGQSYTVRSAREIRDVAERERHSAVHAAERLRTAGMAVQMVSIGSSPTALHAVSLAGVTEIRAGVYMFGDLFQAQLGTHRLDDIAVTVLASVIGRRPSENRLLLDAGGLALSKDRSTANAPKDYGFGLMLDLEGHPSYGESIITRAYQEHGVVECDPTRAFPNLPIGAKVRVAPNHICMTAAAHDRYYVVDQSDEVIAIWTRVNGW
jgi:D-serine deaminase-like pyridoxal phosphate-dependent protein